MSGRPARERVTSVDRPTGRTEPIARPGGGAAAAQVSEAESLFTRGLMRAQVRLALAFVLAFVAVVAGLTFVISQVEALHHVVVAGVPLPWLVQAYGYYPIIAAFAVLYTIAAIRAEHRFRALVEHE
ncbi:heavy metal transporter [Agromyces sp. NPDC056523]|uniref:heavy metal transporter n=1 Tax=Agromyces sp. NPDC056523 TaxID=3345850 RepID=UPI003672795D